MKIFYMSDLHLELQKNHDYVKNKIQSKDWNISGDILILAGDIMYISEPINWFLDWCSANFSYTFICPGNHEFYCGADMKEYELEFNRELRKNVHMVHNTFRDINHVRFIFSTGWSYIRPQNVFNIMRGMSDYKRMKYNGQLITINHMNTFSDHAWKYIESALGDFPVCGQGKCIVTTHYLPTEQVISPYYRGDSLNDGFCIEKGRLISNSMIDYWIAGHSHHNMEVEIGETKVVMNCLGYMTGIENPTFFNNKHFEV